MKERIFYFSDVGKTPMYFMLSFVLFLKEVKTKALQKKQLRSLKWTVAHASFSQCTGLPQGPFLPTFLPLPSLSPSPSPFFPLSLSPPTFFFV